MDGYIPSQSHLTITFLFFFFFFLTAFSTKFHGRENDSKYTLCSGKYNCGELSNISYPFWGENRPFYCGSTEQLQLSCDSTITSFKSFSQNFRVLKIDTISRVMRLVRTDIVYDECTSQLSSTFLNPAIFQYPENQRNITVFYGCPANLTFGKNFTCKNDSSRLGFFAEVSEKFLQQFPEFKACLLRVQVPIFREVGGGGIKSLTQAAAHGFDVIYHINIEEDTKCMGCMKSNGCCGIRKGPNINPQYGRFLCFCEDGFEAMEYCSYHDVNGNKWNKKKTLILGVTCASAIILLTLVSVYYFKWKAHVSIGRSADKLLRHHGAKTIKVYKFSDVKRITNNFQDIVGNGAFGVVYKGRLSDGVAVAVKILKASHKNEEEFDSEVGGIARTSHINIVALLGVCSEGSTKALIYEFMSNGSLDKFLCRQHAETTTPMNWPILDQIAKGVARGLEYLHGGFDDIILHLDIKPGNILLDENFTPKISDFGLAKLCPRNVSSIALVGYRGTCGYMAPEIYLGTEQASHKSDVYSYGIMLLNMVGWQRSDTPNDSHSSWRFFPEVAYTRLEQGIDLRPDMLLRREQHEIAKKMALVGLQCIQKSPNDRPTMGSVIEMLEGNISLQLPPRSNYASYIAAPESTHSSPTIPTSEEYSTFYFSIPTIRTSV